MHTHPDTHICPVYLHTGVHTCAHRYITCTQTMSTSGAHVLMQKHIPKCMHMPLHKYVCTHTHSLVYTCVHTGPGMLAYPDPSAYHGTPTYTQTQNCPCAYRWHQSCTHMCIQDYIQGHVHVHIYIHACLLRTVPHCQCSAIMNSQADPWFPAPSGWLSLPSPQPHDRQLGSCQPQCLPLASHPPGVPRSLINPLTNWPPAP